MIHIPCFPQILILPIVYNHTGDFAPRTIRLSHILPTQPDLRPATLEHYRQRVRMVDEEGALPYGFQFAGDGTVYLTNGHHRWYVCRERGRRAMRMWVYQHPLTLREAIIQDYLARQPKPAPVKPRRVVPLLKPYQQLQFAWQ